MWPCLWNYQNLSWATAPQRAVILLRLKYQDFDREFIKSLDFYQAEFDVDEVMDSLISKQDLHEEPKKYATNNSWYAEEMDWNDAKDSGDIELFNFY